MRVFLLLGSLNMFLSIALGAFGAHGLEGKVSERMMEIWRTAAHYHIVHGLALVAIGLLADRFGGSGLITAAGWLILVGILLFSGSLYAMVLTNVTKLGAITPIGGVAFLAGWVCVFLAAWKQMG
jgi:uncharacterized membrane protein YgdD (TMEM256/DUF423 family)